MGSEDITKPDQTQPDITQPGRHLAETKIGGEAPGVPFGGIGTAEEWLNLLEGGEDPIITIMAAECLAMRASSVRPSFEEKSVNVDQSRIELIFIALNRHCDLVDAGDQGLLQRRLDVIVNAIENGSVFELIQIGKFLMNNQHLCPIFNKLAQLSLMIFEKLANTKAIEEISDEIALRADENW